MQLREKKCQPCEGGIAPLDRAAAGILMTELAAGWRLIDDKKIVRVFTFLGFPAALAFVNQLAALAEKEGHHPDIIINYDRVTVELWTHAIGGLSENDFILASKIDALN